MEQNELRIGNWVLDEGKEVQIDGLQATGRIVVEDWTYDDGKRGIEPNGIKLTGDKIKKCGFDNSKTSTYRKGLFFIYPPGSPESDFGFGVKGIGLIRSIKYIHELQNICFILNGEEIQYTP